MRVSHLGERYKIYRVAVVFTVLCLAVMLSVGCESREQLPKEGEMVLSVSSPAFQEEDRIPSKYTCQGEDVSPPLTWSEPPAGTQSFALVMDDLDAPVGVFTHWVLFNILSDSRQLTEAMQGHILAQGQLTGTYQR